MSDIAVFSYLQQDVRTVLIDGTVYIVVADLARILGYRDAANAARILRDQHKGYSEVSTPSGPQRMLVTNEAGLNRLILRSNAKNAEQVQDWVTDIVLPEIRQTGSFAGAAVAPALPQTFGEALRALADEVEARAALAAKVAEDAPKVAYIDEFVSREDIVKFRTAAAEIGVRDHELRDRLIAKGWIYKQHIGRRWSNTRSQWEDEYEYKAYSEFAAYFKPVPQHNAPRYANGQVKNTLYIRSAFLPRIKKAVSA